MIKNISIIASGDRDVPNLRCFDLHHHQLELLPVAQQGPGAQAARPHTRQIANRSEYVLLLAGSFFGLLSFSTILHILD